jgi:hypothetical protein
MDGVPGRGGDADVIGAGFEAGELVGAGVVGRLRAGADNLSFTGVLIKAVEMNLSATDGLAGFVGDDAGDDGGGEELEAQILRFEIVADDDASVEAIMFLIAGGDVTAA